MRIRLVAFAVAAVSAGGSGGCLLEEDRTCTLIGGDVGLNVTLELPSGTVDGDSFELIARADGVELMIRNDITLAGHVDCVAVPQTLNSGCVASDPRVPTLSLRAQVVGDGGWMELVGGPNPGGPAEAEIVVRRNGVVVAQRTYTPVYQVAEPNGPGCGTFHYAYETLVISP